MGDNRPFGRRDATKWLVDLVGALSTNNHWLAHRKFGREALDFFSGELLVAEGGQDAEFGHPLISLEGHNFHHIAFPFRMGPGLEK